jgi:hypothetical protein
MHLPYINILIFLFSTCLEPEDLSSERRLYIQAWKIACYMHQYKQFSTYKTAYTYACNTYYTIAV